MMDIDGTSQQVDSQYKTVVAITVVMIVSNCGAGLK